MFFGAAPTTQGQQEHLPAAPQRLLQVLRLQGPQETFMDCRPCAQDRVLQRDPAPPQARQLPPRAHLRARRCRQSWCGLAISQLLLRSSRGGCTSRPPHASKSRARRTRCVHGRARVACQGWRTDVHRRALQVEGAQVLQGGREHSSVSERCASML
eukprot:767561-Hanusia_phi.AAC.1